jgi:hypothetical protein
MDNVEAPDSLALIRLYLAGGANVRSSTADAIVEP